MLGSSVGHPGDLLSNGQSWCALWVNVFSIALVEMSHKTSTRPSGKI